MYPQFKNAVETLEFCKENVRISLKHDFLLTNENFIILMLDINITDQNLVIFNAFF